jgi:hypothetical protein
MYTSHEHEHDSRNLVDAKDVLYYIEPVLHIHIR